MCDALGLSSRADRQPHARQRPDSCLHRFHSRGAPRVVKSPNVVPIHDPSLAAKTPGSAEQARLKFLRSCVQRLLVPLPRPLRRRNIFSNEKTACRLLSRCWVPFSCWRPISRRFHPCPVAVSNNAVAALKNGIEIYSLMGVGTKKTWDDITNKMYVLRFSSGKWIERPPGAGSCRPLGLIRGRGERASFCFWGIRGRCSGKRDDRR